ncbi:phage baseplate assembly protein V [Escherichia coli]|nr:phage baseplate assembly protein V [Escherichia coli]EGL0736102.1 phage baseplate assembly protein V [Escherichia coli]
MNAQLTEIMRLITNLIRTGVVTEVDRENWLCRVKTGELETNWISWLTLRAGNARTWWRPSEGEQVVLLSLGGNLETAFALPAVYSNQFAPPSTSADACVTEHPDGGWFEYEPATGRWYVRGIKSMVIEAADNITMKTSEFVLEADRTRINSEVVINGGVNRGFEADQLDLELDDADGKIVLPRRGAVITLALGWKGQPLFPKGAFTVDEIEHTGAPDRLTIRARSADFRETLNTRREKSWHKTTVGEVVKEIAARHKLKMALGKDLSDKPVEHIDQTNESDGSFLMRLARQYGAIASVKNGNLLFIRQGQGKSASGKPLPVITITRKDGDSHRFTLADRGAYTGVIASWLHTREPAKNESTTVKRKRRTKKQKKEPEAKQGDYLVGTDENVLVLNRTYANRSNAERAAKMQWERLQRGVASFSLQLAEGRADLYTEMPVKVSGFKQPIDDAEWTITTLTHTVGPDNGFTTSLELEVRIDDFEME